MTIKSLNEQLNNVKMPAYFPVSVITRTTNSDEPSDIRHVNYGDRNDQKWYRRHVYTMLQLGKTITICADDGIHTGK